jgi:Ca2+-binding EF-hand superfamily protein
MVVRTLALAAGMAALLPQAAVAQPDFAGAFTKLDTDKDGVLTHGEVRHEGVDAERYARPIASYVTDDGYGVELWERPFGISETSTTDEALATRAHQQSRTYPRDVPVRLIPTLMLIGNREMGTMTSERFETELRTSVDQKFEGLDADQDGGISEAEINRMFLSFIDHRQKNPGFQSGAGGEAMRAHSQLLKLRYYESMDLDGDGAITREEMLEAILDRMVAAYAVVAE